MPLERRVAVIGLGYVGLPVAVAFAKHDPVIGFDVDEGRAPCSLRGRGVAPHAAAAGRWGRGLVMDVKGVLPCAERPEGVRLWRLQEKRAWALGNRPESVRHRTGTSWWAVDLCASRLILLSSILSGGIHAR